MRQSGHLEQPSAAAPPAGATASAQDNRRGILAILSASALFICNDTFVKLAMVT